jgi:signal peptidase I
MRKTVLREYYEAILVAFILALFVRTFVFENFKIPSRSMEDNLLVGDHLVVNKFIYSEREGSIFQHILPYRQPRRGDVVVFKFPENPQRDFIKRCVAVAGDKVEISAKKLYINDVLQEEWYVVHKDPRVFPDSNDVTTRDRIRDNYGPRVIEEGEIFCLGDNRDESLDSRYWGTVPLKNVKGRAVLIYWSYEADENDHQWRGMLYRLKQLAEVVIHFPTKTRWDRWFRIIH